VSTSETVVIVGGGQAAAQLAVNLRANGFGGRVVMLCAEEVLPYHRPPLSKRFLLGEMPQDKLLIRKAAYYEKHAIEVHIGRAVDRIDRDPGQVVDSDGGKWDYDYLVLATGGRSRMVLGVRPDMAGVCTLRGLEDAMRLRRLAQPGCHVLLLGGGYIGLETAASLRAVGCEVTVLEAQPTVLQRSVAPEIAERLVDEHARRGSKVRCGVEVAALLGDDAFAGVVTTDGREIPADLLVVGVGMTPNTALAEAAGLACEDGIRVDTHGRTADPAIFAIGDVARRAEPSGPPRLESVDNAIQTAGVVAAVIAGTEVPDATVPWFWSDQYDSKLQMVGLAPAGTQWISRHSRSGEGLSCFFVDAGRLRAAQCLDAAGDFMVAKRLIAAGRPVDAEALGNAAIALRDL